MKVTSQLHSLAGMRLQRGEFLVRYFVNLPVHDENIFTRLFDASQRTIVLGRSTARAQILICGGNHLSVAVTALAIADLARPGLIGA